MKVYTSRNCAWFMLVGSVNGYMSTLARSWICVSVRMEGTDGRSPLVGVGSFVCALRRVSWLSVIYSLRSL